MSKKEAFKKAFESQNIPSDLADQCANILIDDDTRPRTKKDQEIIDKAYKIAFGASRKSIK